MLFFSKIRFESAWTAMFVVIMAATATAFTQDQPTSNMEILRDKLKADKKLLVAENLGLTDAESQKFWPIYEEYQMELEAINQRLGGVIDAYATEYNARSLTDEKAKTLMGEALSLSRRPRSL